jgi:uncharacterized protein YjbI with pentapeptide repeats
VATDPPQPPETAEESEEQSSRVQLWLIVLAVLVLGGVVEVIIYGYVERPGWIGSSGKQFWDYLDLLIVPAALALGVYWLNRRQTERDQRAEDAQQERALAVESQRAQDEALQAFLNQMSELLLDKDRPLRQAEEGDEVQTLARERALTVLGSLDGSRKGSILRFFYESKLIKKDQAVLNLWTADLTGTCLRNARMTHTSLSGADLRGARLEDVNFAGADLSGVDLSEAYASWILFSHANLAMAKLVTADLRDSSFHMADLNHTDLREANLHGANLFEANLRYANVSGANLSHASLYGASLSPTNLRGADLSHADLTNANLSSALLGNANLSGANFDGADLSHAILREANLVGATVAEEQLDSVASLEGATMPNGQKYED